MKYERIKQLHRLSLEASPDDADIAITSIDDRGNPGKLNELVLSRYGYSTNDLPKEEQLGRAGFGAISNTKGKPILFVVTVDRKTETARLLKKNLYNTLVEFRGWLIEKKVWIPLMGTGRGELTLEESYSITVETINTFLENYPTQIIFHLSIPHDRDGIHLMNEVSKLEKVEEKSLETFLKSLNCNFYLAGAFWAGEDQVARFFSEGIWEKGQEDDRYSDIINRIKKNDIIILKSVFAQNDQGFLRVKGIGIVVAPSEDGASIPVDWRLGVLNIDIEGLSKYRNTISEGSLTDVSRIFSLIDPDEWKKLLPPARNTKKIAGLLSDSEKGIDYLDIAKDINAFARVMASKSFEPPLAIALFGKWGSGKSFFMRKLKEQIIDFSVRNDNNMYCEGVVHIHFNAWSYMDANLWASFVIKIFEGLHDYIENDSKARQQINDVKKELSNQLSVTKVGIGLIQEKKADVENQIEHLEGEKAQLKRELEEKISSLKNRTAWDVVKNVNQQFDAKNRIVQALQENKSFAQTEEELKEIIPEKYWSNPDEAYRQIKSKYTFLKEFFRSKNVVKNLWWLVIILFIIFFMPLLLNVLNFEIGRTNFLIPQAVISFLVMLAAAWRRAEAVYNQLQPLAASFWKIKEDYDEQRDKALSKFGQEEMALRLEIEKGKSEILLYDEQLRNAQMKFEEFDYKLNNAFATETLYSFIHERSKSEDYKKYLGIISTIRKDFEILNSLFLDHKSEIVNQRKAEKFRKFFKKPVERIILYIDDLDRCAEENVVQVLEAVNLLMAFPLFIVIVGVDQRWVKNALIKKYALQFAGTVNETAVIDIGVEFIEPSNYLEKIFQIPFHLKDATTESVKEMIRQLAMSKPTQQYIYKSTEEQIPEVHTDGISDVEKSNEIVETVSTTDELSVSVDESIEFLELSEDEVLMMQDMGEIIGPNPRALKRFVNTYKIIKAHEDYIVSHNGPKDDLLAVLFLLALSAGQFKNIIPSLNSFIQDSSNSDKLMSFYFQKLLDKSNDGIHAHKLYDILSGNNNYNSIQQIKASVFDNCNAFVKRFTFKNI